MDLLLNEDADLMMTTLRYLHAALSQRPAQCVETKIFSASAVNFH
jgi:hypothetical protein